jgi:hypothetical protein
MDVENKRRNPLPSRESNTLTLYIDLTISACLSTEQDSVTNLIGRAVVRTTGNQCRITGSHSGSYESGHLLVYSAVNLHRNRNTDCINEKDAEKRRKM